MAKWSKIWDAQGLTKQQKAVAVQIAANPNNRPQPRAPLQRYQRPVMGPIESLGGLLRQHVVRSITNAAVGQEQTAPIAQDVPTKKKKASPLLSKYQQKKRARWEKEKTSTQ